MKVENIPAKDIINEEPVTAQTDENLAQIKNRMEEEELRTIPVVDSKGDLEGAISYRELIRYIQFNPERTKIEKAMHQPPEIKEGSSLVDLTQLRVNSGRKMLVDTEDSELKGVVGDTEFRDILEKVDELNNITTRDIHSYSLEKVSEDTSLDKARHLMLDKNLSRLPVIDEEGNLTGILRSTDLLRAMVPRDSIDSGGTKGDRSGRQEVNIAGGIEKEEMSDIPVKELMARDPFSMEDHIEAKEAAEKLKQKNATEIVFTDGGYPESIVTVKDFIDYLSKFAPGETVLVSLTGLDVPEEKAAVHNKIKSQLRGSLGRKLEKPEEITVRFRKAEKDGKKHRWEIELKLYSELGNINIEEEGWDMLEVMDEALNELNAVVRKKKDKRKP
ncbi:MAG: CBS domain-containing protein/ribosome-associated translation inhibitor RaiA [Candidatus Nanohaloarchaea archaeon]|jgi:CBS domain-containing protein/ribosome-associated translation inhibitor RaiA